MKQCVRCQRSFPDAKVSLGLCDECFEGDSSGKLQNNKLAESVLLSTSFNIPGREIDDIVGLVSAEAALAQSFLKDIGNSWRDFLGGKSNNIQSAIRQVREACFVQLKSEAASLGAHGVVSVQISYHDMSTQTFGGILFIAATGTAVKIKGKPIS